ncbi:kynurenine 3-monooxygenase-like [Ptychodera flava]|uniref:kynurenine 3-monooxygenase-like n=1 Tax=Ptychodera flava TaxID=63121 RepID=UPI00396A45E4
MMSGRDRKRIAVIGGGPVGSLQACFLAKKGFQVDLYESREDIRKAEVVKGRSINLALSVRGRTALKHIGVEEKVVSEGVRMDARQIHTPDGKLYSIQYGKNGQYLLSVDRRKLNETILTAAEKLDVGLHFHHKISRCDLQTGEMVFQGPDGQEVTAKADLIFGCDGAFSTVRRQMMRSIRFDYSQTYIPHGYMELTIPPKNGEFAMDVNFLHIWPRNEFMMIALPNADKSFTCTLFMPFDIFESLKTEEDIMKFWHENYADSIPLIGEENIKQTLLNTKALPMISIKCSPYHHENSCVIMGDAAHAMVPFYGQGMNCGLEDCIVFNELMDKYNDDFPLVLPEYTKIRNPDAKAMCDLAMYNYIEMRASVNSSWFLFRKKVDNLLHWLMPSRFIPLYTMVTFSRIRYHVVIKKWQSQDKLVNSALFAMMGASALGVSYMAARKATFYLNGHLSLQGLTVALAGARDFFSKSLGN